MTTSTGSLKLPEVGSYSARALPWAALIADAGGSSFEAWSDETYPLALGPTVRLFLRKLAASRVARGGVPMGGKKVFRVGSHTIKVENGRISSRSAKNTVALAGASARVESAGDVDRRVTATRVVLTGPLALGLRKKKDSRSLYMTIQGSDGAMMLDLDPKREKDARRAANEINNMASAAPAASRAGVAGPSGSPAAPKLVMRGGGGSMRIPVPAQPQRDKYAQLTQLNELRKQGALSDKEFEREKRKLLR